MSPLTAHHVCVTNLRGVIIIEGLQDAYEGLQHDKRGEGEAKKNIPKRNVVF